VKQHWPFAVLAAIALALIMTNLGADYLWADEGDTAVFAANILKFGVPTSWDGRAFVDYLGRRTDEHLVMVGHPWVQYYVGAGSLALFGHNAFAARLPFALAGWMSILLVYAFVRRISGQRSAAFCAAAVMALSVQFLLYCRHSRYYALTILLTVWIFWIFFEMKSVRQCLLFALAAILLFHSMPFGIAPYAACGLTAWFCQSCARQRRWFLISIPIVALFVLPWLAVARAGYSEDVDRLPSLAAFGARFLQYLIEFASVTPLIGVIVLLIVCAARSKLDRKKLSIFHENEFAFLLAAFLTLLIYATAIALTKSGYGLWLVGIRYTSGAIPLISIAAGLLIAKLARDRAIVWVPLLLLFSFTRLPQLSPWTLGGSKMMSFGANEIVEAHVPLTLLARFLPIEQMLFVSDLLRANPGVVGETVAFLQRHADSEDVVIANYEYEPLYFHTGLRLGLTIPPDSPIYEAARRHQLPEYCFNVDLARWIAWRPSWDLGARDSLAELQRDIIDRGGTVHEAARIRETFWENRENIHFHRFAGGRYLFAWFPRALVEAAPESFPPPENFPESVIFQVDWPPG
jgi:hypothetical protein